MGEKDMMIKRSAVKRCVNVDVACREGHFIKEVDEDFCGSATECQVCPNGMICNFQ